MRLNPGLVALYNVPFERPASTRTGLLLQPRGTHGAISVHHPLRHALVTRVHDHTTADRAA